jgi:hypothetical protein
LVSKAGKHPKKPEEKNFVRVEHFRSVMAMRQKDQNTEFRLIYHDDLKGNIPKTIVNW